MRARRPSAKESRKGVAQPQNAENIPSDELIEKDSSLKKPKDQIPSQYDRVKNKKGQPKSANKGDQNY